MNPELQHDDFRGRRAILVVEGDITIRLSAADELRRAGFTVREASNTGEALVLLRALPDISIVVTDLEKRGSMNGPAIAEWLGREFPHIIVVIASDDGSAKSVAKSYVSEELLARIRALLE